MSIRFGGQANQTNLINNTLTDRCTDSGRRTAWWMSSKRLPPSARVQTFSTVASAGTLAPGPNQLPKPTATCYRSRMVQTRSGCQIVPD